MEIEVKYALPSEETTDAIWSDKKLLEISDTASSEVLPFCAVYYDTEDRALSTAKLTLRVRSEGTDTFATMKWGGSSRKGLHKRQEINVPVDPKTRAIPADPAFGIQPDISWFSDTEIGEKLSELCAGKKLVPAVTMRFTRRRRRVFFEGNTLELALDCGEMTGAKGSLPILEMELEHCEGPDPESVKKLGDELAAKYGLFPENRSKYSRGRTLV